MANYNTLKAAIEAVIRTNGNEEITGAILQDSLIAMINALGLGYQYMGVATAATNPGTPDQKVFYFALAAGTYTNFGGATVRQGITILKWDTAWSVNELFSFAGNYTFSGEIQFGGNVHISSFEEFFDDLNETSLRSELDSLIPRVNSAQDGNIAVFDEYGVVIDGGKSIQDIFDEINKAAKPTGIYEKMVSGSARGILSPSAIEELFLFQRTANGAGGTGAAIFQSIKGNSVVWNQLVQNGNFANGTTGWGVANCAFSVSDGVATMLANGINGNIYQAQTLVVGHKYLYAFDYKGASAATDVLRVLYNSNLWLGAKVFSTTTSWQRGYNIFDCTSISDARLYFRDIRTNGWDNIYITNVILVDLTVLLNGSVPAGYAYADFTKFYNLPYYAPNPGAILNNAATGMVTDGLNQWDEVWESGYWDNVDGSAGTSATWRRNKYPIACFPSTQYCLKFEQNVGSFGYVLFYSSDGNYISSASMAGATDEQGCVFTTPANAGQIRFYANANYSSVKTCINISGPRNGQYEPHWSDTLALPITTATGKLNGEGESVVISPDGLAGVGTYFDEAIVEKGMWTKTKRRFEKVDLGSLTWQVGSGSSAEYNFFYASFSGSPSINIVICDKYVPGAVGATAGVDKSIAYLSNNLQIRVRDLSYNTVQAFTAAVSGIYAYVAITPKEYILDTPVPVVARVDENGTQTILPQGVDESGVPMTAPFKASIQYPVKLGVAPIGQQSLVNLLEKMKSAGKIASYTMVWNATTGAYDFTIS